MHFAGTDSGHGFLNNHPSIRVGDEEDFEDEDGNQDLTESSTVIDYHGCTRLLPLDTLYGFILPPQCSAMTRINFDHCSASCNLLGRILALPLALESFTYTFQGALVGEEPLIAGALIPGLLSQAKTLKELTITDDSEGDLDGDIVLDEDDRLIGSLASLVVLERLRLPAHVLFGFYPKDSITATIGQSPLCDLLPRSLVQLELEQGMYWKFSELLDHTGLPKSLLTISDQLPALRVLWIQRYMGVRLSPDDGYDVEGLMADVGQHYQIDLKIVV